MADFDNIELKETRRILDQYAEDYQALFKTRLQQPNEKGWNKVASGALLASISTNVEYGGNRYTVYLNSLDYLQYIEYGTKPHFPPYLAMLKWVRDKKLPTQELTGDKSLPREKRLAYLVQQKIGREGTEAFPIVANTAEELNERYVPLLEAALAKDISDIVNQNPLLNLNIIFKFK